MEFFENEAGFAPPSIEERERKEKKELERKALIKEDVERAYENRARVSADLDKWIIGGGTGLIVVSAGFLQISNLEVVNAELLFIAWIFFAAAAAVVMLVSYLVLKHDTKGQEYAMNRYKGLFSAFNTSPDEIKHITTDTDFVKKLEDKRYPTAFMLLLIGVSFFGYFTWQNIKNKNVNVRAELKLKTEKDTLELEKIKTEIERNKQLKTWSKG